MFIVHHCSQPVILYNQARVLLGCDNIHKAKKKKRKKKEREVVGMSRFELGREIRFLSFCSVCKFQIEFIVVIGQVLYTRYTYKCVFFTLRHSFIFGPRVFPRALGSVEHREPARTQYTTLGPGRGPWHVFWGLNVARPLGEAFRTRTAIQAHANPHVHNTVLTG